MLIVFALDAAFLFYSYQDYLRYCMPLPPKIEIPEDYVDTRAGLALRIAEISIRMEQLRSEYEEQFDEEIGQQAGILKNFVTDRESDRPIAPADQGKLALLEEYFEIQKQREVHQKELDRVEKMHMQYWAAHIDKWEPLRFGIDFYLPHALLILSMMIAAIGLDYSIFSVSGLLLAIFYLGSMYIYNRFEKANHSS
ncbi:MAG: hypothetical protein ACKVJG_04740 [Candidatus Latescibacterota bacterium]